MEKQAVQQLQRVGNSTDDQIKSALKNIFFLIGVPDYKLPESEYLVGYLKRSEQWKNISLSEITTAFESAAENLFIDLSLDGKTFNPAFMRQVVMAYREFKGKQRVVKEDAINIKDQATSIYSMLLKENPALLNDLKKIGNPKVTTSSEAKAKDDIYQQLMREFDKLHKDQFDPDRRSAIRAVKYSGRMLSIEEYINERLNELNPPPEK